MKKLIISALAFACAGVAIAQTEAQQWEYAMYTETKSGVYVFATMDEYKDATQMPELLAKLGCDYGEKWKGRFQLSFINCLSEKGWELDGASTNARGDHYYFKRPAQ